MSMTNYMELLMTNQPSNLILFMVIPVGLAEFLVATVFYSLYYRNEKNIFWKKINKILGVIAGIYFSIIFLYSNSDSRKFNCFCLGIKFFGRPITIFNATFLKNFKFFQIILSA